VTSRASASVNSQARSTIGSLRLTSPYSESIFSLQSLSSTATKTAFNEKNRSLSRSVLLPHEIDDLARFLGRGITNVAKSNKTDDENDSYNNLSDFDDDDSTVNSEGAISIDDAAIFQHMKTHDNDDSVVLGNRSSNKLDELLVDQAPKTDTNESSPQIKLKLPSVTLDTARYDEAKPTRKKTRSSGGVSRSGNNVTSTTNTNTHIDQSTLLNSPYVTQIKTKKSKKKATTAKKSGTMNFSRT